MRSPEGSVRIESTWRSNWLMDLPLKDYSMTKKRLIAIKGFNAEW
jgi:hypothetical protein